MEIGEMQLEKAWPCCLPRDLLGTRQHHSGTHLGSSASSHRPDEIPAFPLFLPSPECLQGGAAALHCQGQEQSPPGQRVLIPEQARLLLEPHALPHTAQTQGQQAGSPGRQEQSTGPRQAGKGKPNPAASI